MKRYMVFGLILLFFGLNAFSQFPSIEEKVLGMKKYPGYFTFYWEEQTGEIWLEIDKMGLEFLYVHSLRAGLGSNDIGLDRNQLGGTKVVKFIRMGPKVFLLEPNYSYRALSDNPYEKKAVNEAFADSIIWGFEVCAAQNEKVLVNATPFLLRDAHGVMRTMRRAGQGDYRLDPSRSSVFLPDTKNFPKNTEFEAILTFTSPYPGGYVREVAPDASAVSLTQHHSFIELPDEGFEMRMYDPRSNFSSFSFTDYSAPVGRSMEKRFIRRHRLKKKDPSAEKSEPVEPIVYYVDRGCPEPILSALIEGAEWWNEAFEEIGYKNAFKVKVLPEKADPMDIRYNVINWVHRSKRGWSYGASVTDPRTGEIIKGHVALGSQRIRQDFLIGEALNAVYDEKGEVPAEILNMALARIRQLSCHEVGHTLGLGHNYAASVNDRASVMDYPHPLIEIDEQGNIDLSNAYAEGVGEWDKVSIAYGYQDFSTGKDEEKELKAILDNAFSRGLYFLSGQDAREGSAHPLAAVWDNGENPIDELYRIMRIRSAALQSFSKSRVRYGEPVGLLRKLIVPVYLLHRYQVEAAASALGGLVYNHRLRGDVQEDPRIVPASEQKRALDALLQTVSPENLVLDEGILKDLPPFPPGYRQDREIFQGHTGLPFDPSSAAEAAAWLTFESLFHPYRCARMIEYHARREEVPGLNEVLDKVIDFTWKTPNKKGMHAEVSRVVDQVLLKSLMRLAVNPESSVSVQERVFLKLEELKEWCSDRVSSVSSAREKAHYHYGVMQIEQFQRDPEKIELERPTPIPPGAPIGGGS
ncbi:MAG: zinc-dependent metalloprotease [Acidobacteriota bacterium]